MFDLHNTKLYTTACVLYAQCQFHAQTFTHTFVFATKVNLDWEQIGQWLTMPGQRKPQTQPQSTMPHVGQFGGDEEYTTSTVLDSA